MDKKKIKVIVDCDGGSDDAVALIMLIKAHQRQQIDLKAITCVAGNTGIENVVDNVFRTLETCDATNIPVYKGAHSALISSESSAEARDVLFHGCDGFGDVFNVNCDTSKLQKDHAIIALHEIITGNPQEISVIAIGPVTNIALAIRVFPDILKDVKDFYVMGGNSTARGNVTSQAEFNFYADPESIHILLESNTKPLWLLPWETCLDSQINQKWRDNVLGKIDTKAMELINLIEDGVYSTKPNRDFYVPCDAFLAGVVLSAKLIRKSTDFHADIELHGRKTRGQVVLDHFRHNKSNIHLIEELDTELFQELLLEAFDPSYKSN